MFCYYPPVPILTTTFAYKNANFLFQQVLYLTYAMIELHIF